jgi:hypothetical protein
MRYLTTVSLLLVSFSSAMALNTMTHEEQTVRATYGKVAFAARTGVLLHYALEGLGGSNNVLDPSVLKRELDSQLAFRFEAVNVGNLADIADVRWDALVTKPQLDLISVAFAYHKQPMKVGHDEPFSSMSYVIATWQRWDDHEWNWNTPVRQAIDDLPKDTLKPEVVYCGTQRIPLPRHLAPDNERTRQFFCLARIRMGVRLSIQLITFLEWAC